MDVTRSVLYDVEAERAAQDDRWGQQELPNGTGRNAPPSLRGMSDLAKRRAGLAAAMGELTWRDVLLEEVFEAMDAETVPELRAELVQVAAVAVQWVEAIDRKAAAADGGEH